MKKKIILAVLLFLLTMALVGCGITIPGGDSSSSSNSATSSEAPAESSANPGSSKEPDSQSDSSTVSSSGYDDSVEAAAAALDKAVKGLGLNYTVYYQDYSNYGTEDYYHYYVNPTVTLSEFTQSGYTLYTLNNVAGTYYYQRSELGYCSIGSAGYVGDATEFNSYFEFASFLTDEIRDSNFMTYDQGIFEFDNGESCYIFECNEQHVLKAMSLLCDFEPAANVFLYVSCKTNKLLGFNLIDANQQAIAIATIGDIGTTKVDVQGFTDMTQEEEFNAAMASVGMNYITNYEDDQGSQCTYTTASTFYSVEMGGGYRLLQDVMYGYNYDPATNLATVLTDETGENVLVYGNYDTYRSYFDTSVAFPYEKFQYVTTTADGWLQFASNDADVLNAASLLCDYGATDFATISILIGEGKFIGYMLYTSDASSYEDYSVLAYFSNVGKVELDFQFEFGNLLVPATPEERLDYALEIAGMNYMIGLSRYDGNNNQINCWTAVQENLILFNFYMEIEEELVGYILYENAWYAFSYDESIYTATIKSTNVMSRDSGYMNDYFNLTTRFQRDRFEYTGKLETSGYVLDRWYSDNADVLTTAAALCCFSRTANKVTNIELLVDSSTGLLFGYYLYSEDGLIAIAGFEFFNSNEIEFDDIIFKGADIVPDALAAERNFGKESNLVADVNYCD